MTDIYLDGMKLDYEDSANDSTLEDIALMLEKEVKPLNRVLSGLSVDGQDRESWKDERVLKDPISAFKELNFTTRPVEALVLEGYDTLQEYLELITGIIDFSVAEARKGRGHSEAVFSKVFEGLNELVKTMNALERINLRYGIRVFNETPAAYYGPILGHMESLKQALNASDEVVLTDILEHELSPYLVEIKEKIFNLRKN